MSTEPGTPVRTRATPQPPDVMLDDAGLARLAPDERAAIYLNSIRKMMIFFTIVLVVGIIAGIIVGIIDINAVNHLQQTSTGGITY